MIPQVNAYESTISDVGDVRLHARINQYRCGTQRADEASIRQLENEQAVAWKRHDAKAYTALFSEGGDVVNVLGWWWQGRAQIQSKLEAAFSVVFHISTLTIVDVNTRFLTSDIAMVDVRWTMTGALSPPDVPPPKGVSSSRWCADTPVQG